LRVVVAVGTLTVSTVGAVREVLELAQVCLLPLALNIRLLLVLVGQKLLVVQILCLAPLHQTVAVLVVNAVALAVLAVLVVVVVIIAALAVQEILQAHRHLKAIAVELVGLLVEMAVAAVALVQQVAPARLMETEAMELRPQ
jgi:hypothetical protein